MDKLSRIITDDELESVYVFGSWLTSREPRDIDLLFVYDPDRCPISRALELRQRIEEVVEIETGLPPHIVLLSVEEENEIGFVECEQCVQIM